MSNSSLLSAESDIQRLIITDFRRPTQEVISALTKCYTGHVLDYQDKKGAMNPMIKPLLPGMTLCGPAVTCSCPDLDVRRMAINLAQPGDVLVIAAGGDCSKACFGDGTAMHMYYKGLAGVVIDGATRDASRIRVMRFPTFARGCTPENYRYPTPDTLNFSADQNLIGVNIDIVCGGIIVHPGDVILADDDGVVVIPQDTASDLSINILKAMWKKDIERLERLDKEYEVIQKLLDRKFTIK